MADDLALGRGAFGATAAGAAAKPTRRRFLIMGMLFITVVINYLDRSNLSIASPHISAQFHLTPTQMGLIFSAFGWIYGPMCIPGGWLVDRIRPRIFYPATILLWSLATYGFGVSTGFAMLIAVRLLVGLFEVPSFLINNRIATTWFGENERATCVGAYTAAEYVGLAFLLPILAWLLTTFGWPSVFFVTGTIGVIWSVIFFLLYREPRDMKGANQAEIDLIASSGGIPDLSERMQERRGAREAGSLWANFGVVFGRRKLWGLYIGEFCWATTNTFFLTWFPTYLVQYRHFSFLKAGFYGSVPFLAAFCGVICSGLLSDFCVRRGVSLSVARKTPIIGGMLLASVIIGANFVNSAPLVIMFMAIAFFANGLASIHWSLVSAVAPERLIGLTSGTFNFVGSLAFITTPIVIGHLLTSGSISGPLTFVAVTAAVGAAAYVFLVGRVERVAE
ncbi:MAG TPA: MFS transporter [Acidocella sp.]|nr:MFS transporter [Acidocella sp.]